MEPIIRFDKLTFMYGMVPMFKNIDLDFHKEKVSVLLGRNGSGKSTLVRLAAGLITPQSGSVLVKGQPLSSINQAGRSRVTGFLPQSHHAVFPFTVRDVVLTGRAGQTGLIPAKKDMMMAEHAIESAGISHLGNRPYTSLSGGEQQMVLLARVLAQDPEIIILDEPSSHLDLNHSEHLFRFLKNLSRTGKTIIMVLHDPIAAMAWADHFVCIGDDFTISLRDPATITPHYLEYLYGVPFTEVLINSRKHLLVDRA